jgi:hypothetical protein
MARIYGLINSIFWLRVDIVETESSSETSIRIKNACLETLKSRQIKLVIVTFQDFDRLEMEYDLFNLVKYGNQLSHN